MKTILLLSFALFTFALPVADVEAQVFKCKGPEGRIVYQDGPCEGGAAVDTRSPKGVGGSKAATSGGASGSAPPPTKPTHPVLPERLRQ